LTERRTDRNLIARVRLNSMQRGKKTSPNAFRSWDIIGLDRRVRSDLLEIFKIMDIMTYSLILFDDAGRRGHSKSYLREAVWI